MPILPRRALPGALILCSLAVPATAAAAPVTVNLRVEGATQTIFEGPVITDTHQVTTPSDGMPRPCDGSSIGAPSGPTAIGALDDAARAAGFAWDAAWDGSFSDYYPFLRIGPDAIDGSHYLALFVNWAFAQAGGCGQRVSGGEDVLFAYEDFNESPPLRLTGPGSAATGQSVPVTVVDGATGAAQEGATVAGATTGSDGRAFVSIAQRGIYRLKAEKPGAIRSNAIILCVDPAGALPCSSTDTSGPGLLVETPAGAGGGLASARGQSRTMLISWAGDDRAGSGVSNYTAEVSEIGGGAGASQAGWRTLVGKTPATGVHFRGKAGHAYVFRITATDRALNETTITTGPVIVPVDDRSRKLWRFSKKGWKRIRNRNAWGRTVIRAREAGATARLRFSGKRVVLVGRRLPKGGRLRATVDRRPATVRLRGRSGHRSVVWTSRELTPGAHTLTLRTLGGGPVVLDAVAPTP